MAQVSKAELAADPMFGNLAMARPVSFWWDIVQYLFGDRELKQLPLCLNCLPLYRGGRFSAQLVLSGSLLPFVGVIIFSVIIAPLTAVLLFFPGKNICI